MDLHFQYPEMMWILAAAVPLVIAFTWRTGLGSTRTTLCCKILFRSLWVAVLILALARPTVFRTRHEEKRVRCPLERWR